MHIKYFGDSYDIVKQSFIRWLGDFGEWSVHPMFTEPVTPAYTSAFTTFLGARLLSDAVLKADTDRPTYFACASRCGNLFLDPNTGLRVMSVNGRRAPQFLFASELIFLVQNRPAAALTLVFDQSHPRGSAGLVSLNQKLQHLSDHQIPAFAYASHACFIVAGHDPVLVKNARARLLAKSQLPEYRLVSQTLST